MRCLILFMVICFSVAVQAYPGPATKEQRKEFKRLLDKVVIDTWDAKAILEKYKMPDPEECQQIEVDYDIAIADMKNARKNYYIDGKFSDEKYWEVAPPSKGKVVRDVCWLRFREDITILTMERIIKASDGLQPADFWGLYAFGLVKPNFEHDLKMLALGTSSSPKFHYLDIDGAVHFAALEWDSEEPKLKNLELAMFQPLFDVCPNCGVLVFRK